MRGICAVAICAAGLGSSAAKAEKAPCAPREAGQSYPWQSSGLMRGDKYAWVFITVDRTGRPIRCGVGNNNIPDPEMRFRLCAAYSADWRAPAASPGAPDVRTIKRQTIMISYEHEMADQKKRKLWFKQHPEERAECYPQ